MTNVNLPALSLPDLQAVPNNNGNSRSDMTAAMVDLRKAYEQVLKALCVVQQDVTHPRNYQTTAADTWLQGQLQATDSRNIDALKSHAVDVMNWAYDQAVTFHG